jgi:hypothetical protein
MSKRTGSKRKERACEVEFVPVYHKRLRKSFFTLRNVSKTSESKVRATTPSLNESPPLDSSFPTEMDPSFTFKASGQLDYGPINEIKWEKKKSRPGKVNVFPN